MTILTLKEDNFLLDYCMSGRVELAEKLLREGASIHASQWVQRPPYGHGVLLDAPLVELPKVMLGVGTGATREPDGGVERARRVLTGTREFLRLGARVTDSTRAAFRVAGWAERLRYGHSMPTPAIVFVDDDSAAFAMVRSYVELLFEQGGLEPQALLPSSDMLGHPRLGALAVDWPLVWLLVDFGADPDGAESDGSGALLDRVLRDWRELGVADVEADVRRAVRRLIDLGAEGKSPDTLDAILDSFGWADIREARRKKLTGSLDAAGRLPSRDK